MPDLTESLIAFIDAALTDAYPSADFHVGEIIPENVETDFVWLVQSGESTTGDLCDEVDRVRYDVEIVTTEIEDCRAWAATIKTALRDADNFDAAWNGNAQFATVEDHDDDYVPRNQDADEQLNVASLAVEMHV